MRIVLIFPNIHATFPSTRTHQSLGIAYLASSLRAASHEVIIVDATVERMPVGKIAARVEELKPRIVGITTNVGMASQAIATSRAIKASSMKPTIVMGGPWATIEHEMILKHGLADIVVRGEGDVTLVELANVLESNSDLDSVQGISRVKGNKIIVNEQRPFITDLDTLPFPAWDLFPPSKKYRFLHRGNPFFPVMTSRGCPYDCIHCTKVVHGYTYRSRSVGNILAELRYLKDRFNVKEIFIIDDNFNHDLERAERIIEGIIKENLNLKIKFTNGIRADRITNQFVKKLKMAGAYAVTLGIESGNQHIVNSIGKKLHLSEVIKAKRLFRNHGFIIGGFFMLGHPNDTRQTMMQTVAFAKALDLDYPFFFKAVPFPGTKMHDMVKANGRFLHHMTSSIVEKFNVKHATFEMHDLVARDVEEVFNSAYRGFYLRPKKILHLLSQYRSFMEFYWIIDTVLKIFVKNA